MIVGDFAATLGDQSRIALPKKIREQVTGIELVLAKGFEGCIFGFQKSVWEEIAKQELLKPVSTEEGRRIRRQMFAAAEIIAFDEQGRYVLPKTLKEYAHLTRDVVIIGAGDHFEIWDKTRWQEYVKTL